MVKKKWGNTMREELNGLAADGVGYARKNMKIISPILFGGAFLAALVAFFIVVLPLHKTAEKAGREVGASIGRLTGTAVGSVNGGRKAVEEYAEQKYEALTADDTVAEIRNAVQSDVHSLGNLQVLVGDVALSTDHKVGDTYAALYLLYGKVIFSVDLNKATVTMSPDSTQMAIVLPQPSVQINIDHEKTEKRAEWMKTLFNGKEEDGFTAYLTTVQNVRKASTEQVADYETLLEMATEFAINQVRNIAEAGCRGRNITVTVTVQAA